MLEKYKKLSETDEVSGRPAVRGFLKYIKDDKRTRLYFQGLREEHPQIANAVELTRSRVTDLQTKFREDADVAMRRFRHSTKQSIIGTGAVASIGLIVSLIPTATFGVALIPAVAIIAALFPAASSAFGWHNRFNAMFSAAWRLKGLKSRIDQELILIALQANREGGTSEELIERLNKSVAGWTDSLEKTLSSFGEELGGAINPISLPKVAGVFKFQK